MIITTIHGTKFQLDFEQKKWERINKTGDSGNLRTESGTFFEATEPVIGQEFRMVCPLLTDPHIPARMIITSPIAAIEE